MTQEEKLKTFMDAIRVRSQKEIQAIAVGEEKRREADEKEAKERAEADSKVWLEVQINNARTEAGLKVAARKAANRRRLLEFREKAAAEAFATVKDRIAIFTVSPDYAAHLSGLLKKALDELGRDAPVTVYLRREDMACADYLRGNETAPLTFAEGSFGLGGLQVAVPTENKRADLSFDTDLRDLRGRFAELSGLEID
jgi:vacuolar-type H+-ATPase subunit E/Vma4